MVTPTLSYQIIKEVCNKIKNMYISVPNNPYTGYIEKIEIVEQVKKEIIRRLRSDVL